MQFYPIAGRLASARFQSGMRAMPEEVRLSGHFLFDMLTTCWLLKSTFREDARWAIARALT
jgi:hypothetical protein